MDRGLELMPDFDLGMDILLGIYVWRERPNGPYHMAAEGAAALDAPRIRPKIVTRATCNEILDTVQVALDSYRASEQWSAEKDADQGH